MWINHLEDNYTLKRGGEIEALENGVSEYV